MIKLIVFTKKKVLFGMKQLKINKKPYIILCQLWYYIVNNDDYVLINNF